MQRATTTTTDLNTIQSVEQLEEALSEPRPYVLDALANLTGDLVILGAGGKMGPTLARMAKRAFEMLGRDDRVMAVSRYSDPKAAEALAQHGVEIISADLLDEAAVAALPDAANVVFMAGMKFGSTGAASKTWAMNAYVPALVARRYADSRIAAFSTGNVYGLAPVTGGGSVETDDLQPVGEYAMSCLGRERMFDYFSRTYGTPTSIIRLNYAVELRYGVIVDLAQRIAANQPIDLSMGTFNAIWQTDANAMTLASLAHADSPPFVLNVTGPEKLRVRAVCERLADRMGKAVRFENTEADDALLNDASKSFEMFGKPAVAIDAVIDRVADWISAGGDLLGKPTHFENREGRF